MNNANAEKSARLQRTLEILRAFPEGATTFDLQCLSNSMAPATDVSECRANGYDIECRYQGKTSTGRRIYSYHYKGRKES